MPTLPSVARRVRRSPIVIPCLVALLAACAPTVAETVAGGERDTAPSGDDARVPTGDRGVRGVEAEGDRVISAEPEAAPDPIATGGSAGGAPAGALLVARNAPGGAIPADFLGFSLEWTLIPRHMGDAKKRARFTRYMTNLGKGMLRIGGMSQESCDQSHVDVMPTFATAPYLEQLRETLVDTGGGATRWKALLGLPSVDFRECDGSQRAAVYAANVDQAFASSRDWLTGVEIGNEFNGQIDDGSVEASAAEIRARHPSLATTAGAHHTFSAKWKEWKSGGAAPRAGLPNGATGSSYHFDLWSKPGSALNWTTRMGRAAKASSLPFVTDHYYQLVSNIPSNAWPYGEDRPNNVYDPTYHAAVIDRLLDQEHMRDTAWQLYRKGEFASGQFGKKVRLAESNSIAGRGTDGISNRMVSAIWGLHYLFTVACPFDPALGVASNPTCDTRSAYVGVNFHHAERDALDQPANAAYNVVTDDGRAMPMYYAFLLFGRYAQGKQGLRRLHETPSFVVFRVDDGAGETNVFIINKSRTAPANVVIATATTAQARSMKLWNVNGLDGDYAGMRLGGQTVQPDGSFDFSAALTPRPSGTSWTTIVQPGEIEMIQLY